MKVVLTPFAVEDIELAHQCYAEIRHGLEQRFVDAIDAAIDRIMMFPDGAPAVEGFDGLRRARTRQFPFGIVYRRQGSAVLLIVRVLHSRQQHGQALTDA